MKPERDKKVKKKIVLTGGHAVTTALAVIEELAKKGGRESFWDIYWIGVRKAVEGKKVPTLEYSRGGFNENSVFGQFPL